jgi:hypothetical protein
MNKYRNRAFLYLAEVALGAALVLLPVQHDLLVLTAVGLFMHLTTSLGALPFQWRFRAMGPGPGTVFGIPEQRFFKGVVVAGLALMASWFGTQSTATYLTGVFVAVSGVEALVTRGEYA